MAEKKGLWTSLRSVFGGKDEPPPPISTNKSQEEHWVEMSLDQMLASDPQTQVHIVTLRQYRDALGENWSKLESKVMMLAESVLRRVLKHGGVMSQKDDSFLIVYKPPHDAQGGKHTAEAAIELGQRLVGAKFSMNQGAGPSVAYAETTAAAILDDSGRIDPQKLSGLASQARSVLTGDEPAAAKAAAKAAPQPIVTTPVEGGIEEKPTDWQLIEKRKKQQRDIQMVTIDPPRKKRPEPEWVPMKRD